MEKERQGNVEYKRFGIQGTADKETDGSIYQFIYY